MAAQVAMSPDVLITIKLQIGLENRRFKLPLKELGANTLPDKVSSKSSTQASLVAVVVKDILHHEHLQFR